MLKYQIKGELLHERVFIRYNKAMFALEIVVQTWPFKREINKLFCDRYGGFYFIYK